MTTPVNSFQDILDVLEQNPELRNRLRMYMLTEELLQLPAQFLLLRKDVDELKTGQDDLRKDVDELKTGQGSCRRGRTGSKDGWATSKASCTR